MQRLLSRVACDGKRIALRLPVPHAEHLEALAHTRRRGSTVVTSHPGLEEVKHCVKIKTGVKLSKSPDRICAGRKDFELGWRDLNPRPHGTGHNCITLLALVVNDRA